MPTTMLCSKCGGTLGAAMPGTKACSCKRPADGTGTVAIAEAPSVTKKCVTCGKDVTNEKRMKDSSTGKYWCYDCGVKQPGAQTQALICPKCKKPMSAHSMYRVNDQYVCQTCHDDKTKPKAAGKSANGMRTALIGGAVLLVAAVSAYLNGWLPI